MKQSNTNHLIFTMSTSTFRYFTVKDTQLITYTLIGRNTGFIPFQLIDKTTYFTYTISMEQLGAASHSWLVALFFKNLKEVLA